VIAHASAPS